ncbi:hypothetical protein BCIN_05g06470 [Botrytis cinerea B05.10]|uniref:Uncharacterized protein n=3 Tax=Botryotinia fuckeliana TaxID=40559 RepID=A0A384JI87_BOTFB|nr:hypothetical protein BCIN_05g06470 [Botrytis cinerea B05.10]ATZ50280.1 hypothetical protein BCIN_05g06470 [Botrytis cinerea B05.10]CCD53428.1 similar to Ca2+/Na+ antiporter [Botrytis cinerea T4]
MSELDNIAVIAARFNVSPTLIALLTSAAEWEEVGENTHVDSSIENLTRIAHRGYCGPFSASIFARNWQHHRIIHLESPMIYTTILVIATSIFSSFLLFFEPWSRIARATLIADFVSYVTSIAYAICKGIVSSPEDDSDNGSDTSLDERDFEETEFEKSRFPMRSGGTRLQAVSRAIDDYENLAPRESAEEDNEEIGSKNNLKFRHKKSHSIFYRILHFILGLLSLSLSGYILSRSITSLAATLSLSTTVLGTAILFIATTLPE